MRRKETRGRKPIPENGAKTMFSFRVKPETLKIFEKKARRLNLTNTEAAQYAFDWFNSD